MMPSLIWVLVSELCQPKLIILPDIVYLSLLFDIDVVVYVSKMFFFFSINIFLQVILVAMY